MSLPDADLSGNQYWNAFYRTDGGGRLSAPSQFAAFVFGELHDDERIVDVGCGNGRDALFFASMGRDVTGIDASEDAVARCTAAAARAGVGARFHCAAVGRSDLPALLRREAGPARPTLVYSRFFLHAIRDDEEAALLDFVVALRADGPVRLAMEFRTHRDANLPKATATHFRRFVDPTALLGRVATRGFAVEYFVEGFGYAKYKADDAHVARVILSR